MKVDIFRPDENIYSAFAYFIRGSWNAINDVNVLIDTGRDPKIIDFINNLNTGLGKRKLELIILTHEHFDHSGMLAKLKEIYKPRAIAFSKNELIDELAYDGMKIKIGDEIAEILHTPGHSNDSICIYFPESGALFSGDTILNIKSPGGTYTKEYLEVLKRIQKLKISVIYSGHDEPITKNIDKILENSIKNVKESNIF